MASKKLDKGDNCPDLEVADRFQVEYFDGENQVLRFSVTNGLLWIEMGDNMVSVNRDAAYRIKALLDEFYAYGRVSP